MGFGRRIIEIDPTIRLKRRLNIVGRETFVRHFWLFRRLSRKAIDRIVVVDAIMNDRSNRKSYDACVRACAAAMLIWRDEQVGQAMRMIVKSSNRHFDNSLRLKAISIKDQLKLENIK